MKERIRYSLLILIAIVCTATFLTVSFDRPKETASFYDVKLGGIENPIGYNMAAPTFSWKLKSPAKTETKTAQVNIYKSSSPEMVGYKIVEGNVNHIAFDYETEFLPFLEPRTRYMYIIQVTDTQDSVSNSEPYYFETGKLGEDWTGKWITTNPKDTYAPVFKKDFNLDKELDSARLYISGLGLYEAYLNDEKIGNEVLTPYYSNYKTEVEYQTYDITDYLNKNNELKVYLGNGWYKGRFSLLWSNYNYGQTFNLIYEIHLIYKDGSKDTVVSDESTTYGQNYITQNNLYDGETQDLRILNQEELNNPSFPSYDPHLFEASLTERYSIPVVEKEEIKPVELILTPKNEYIIDFGQNFAGYIEVTHDLESGQALNLQFAEVLQDGCFYNENYRTAKATYGIISDGKQAVSKPHFTYFGFRYVKVEGLEEAPDINNFKGIALYSDMDVTGSITTGHDGINQLFSNTLWSQKSNFINLPTDCPQRDEKLGWTGDTLVFSPTATYNMDTYAFYRKFLHELRVMQQINGGEVPVVIPDIGIQPNMNVSCAWSDVATFLPLLLYNDYGDENILKENYPLMTDWVDYIERKDKEHGQNYLWDFNEHYGDWLSVIGSDELPVPLEDYNHFLATCYWAQDTKNVIEAAGILGQEEDKKKYEDLYQKILNTIQSKYFTSDGKLTIDTQTAYLTVLDFDLCPDTEVIKTSLKERLEKDEYKITGGFLGGTQIIQILTDYGMNDEATKVLLQEECPSWLFEVNLGSTTIWERWDVMDENGYIQNFRLGSLNHYAYGSVIEALYANYAGLKPAKPGFSEVNITPIISPELGSTKVTYDSPSGEYIFEWKINGNTCNFMLEVPYGCKANVSIPDKEEQTFGPGTYEWSTDLN